MPTQKKVPIRDDAQKVAAYQAAAGMEGTPEPSETPSGEAQVDGVAGEQNPEPDAAGDLSAQLEAARKEASDHYDRLLRATAEFENYKKRASRELEEFRKYANEQLLRELLSVVDNLERALAVCDEVSDGAGIRQGVELTLSDIHKLLERFFVRPVASEGQPFDPAFHQAMMQEASAEVPENSIIRTLQKGYTIHDRLLRPAMVVVATAPASEDDASSAADTTDAQS